MTIIDRPPTEVRSIEILTSGIWLWSWIPPVFPSSIRVRPADMDGWVEQGGQILMLDGCIGCPPKPSQAISIATRNAKNITYLALSTEMEMFDAVSHEPTNITHYGLLPAQGWSPQCYQWGPRWNRMPGQPHGLWQASAIIAQWAGWAVHWQEPVS